MINNIFKKKAGLEFFSTEAHHSIEGDSESSAPYSATESDKEFIDDSEIPSQDPILAHEEHKRNIKRIAKNLDEFADCLTFEVTDLNSLKSFLLQMQ